MPLLLLPWTNGSIAKRLPLGMLRPEECDHDRLSVRSTAPTASAEQLDMFGA